MSLVRLTPAELAVFVAQQPPTSGLFLQTSSWWEFERAGGHQAEAVGFQEQGSLLAAALITLRQLAGGWRYAYVPRGPLGPASAIAKAAESLVVDRGERGLLFLRIEPPYRDGEVVAPPGFIAARPVQPSATLLTDLRVSPEQLLAQMHPKTRYNIKVAQRHGLTWQLVGSRALGTFLELLAATARRGGFSTHPPGHYVRLVELFGERPLSSELAVRVAEVRDGERVLAASLLIFCHGVVTYLHGASVDRGRERMPTYLLHWEAMREAQRHGFVCYDWWGIASERHPRWRWAGMTRFKRGFGGQVVDLVGTLDYPYRTTLYRFYRTAQRLHTLV